MDSQLAEHRILRMDEVCKLAGLAKATIYKNVNEGRFPPPIRLGARSVGWRLSDILAWQQAQERQWAPTEVK